MYRRKVDTRRIILTIHNVVAHPVMSIFNWAAVGFERIGLRNVADAMDVIAENIHSVTLPVEKPRDR